MSSFTKHDEEMLKIFMDPAKWAEYHLGDIPRWYQEQILRHPHHRMVLRCGRRVGKCIEENQRVLNPKTGAYLSVGNLYNMQKEFGTQELITLNEQYKLEESKAFFIEDNGIKETFIVRTKYGSEVTLTGNHPVLTLDGWVEVDALKIGDRIATPKSLPYFGDTLIDHNLIKMMAYLLVGGYKNKGYVTFSSKNQNVLLDFAKVARHVGVVATRKLNAEGTFLLSSTLDTDLFDRMVKIIQQQAVPQEIFTLPKDYVALFINTLYASGGWAHNGVRPEIGVSSTSRALMIDLKHLLLRFGIRTNLATKKGIKELLIHRRGDLLLFTSEIGIAGKTDLMTQINEVAEDMEIYEHTVPKEVWVHIENERIDKRLSKADVTGSKDERLRMNAAPGISKIAKYAENLQSAFLFDLARADLVWEEVTEIIPHGKRQTYDVFVPETHNLVCEDIMVHNTWTMCAHMLWVAFTCNGGAKLVKGATCIVATPYESQARLIYDQLITFINNNPVLADSVSNTTKNPYYIQFKNKSQIKLFTAGTRSGAEGGSLRGQSAD